MKNIENEIKIILSQKFELPDDFESKVMNALNSKSKVIPKSNIVIYLSIAVLLLLNLYATSILIPSDNSRSKYISNRNDYINYTSKYYTNLQYLN